MKRLALLGSIVAAAMAGCSIESALRANDERYLRPGALDTPRTGVYSTYIFNLMGRYRVTHEWVNTTPCAYRAYERPAPPGRYRSNVWDVPGIYESDGKTWQGNDGFENVPPKNLDRWVRSIKQVSTAPGGVGKVVETGMESLCLEAWWGTNHYMVLRLRRASVDAVQEEFSRYTAGEPVQWTTRMLNGLTWRVMEVPDDKLRPRRPNSVGAPHQTWIAPLGDSGYAMAFSLGASRESLDFPQAHAAFQSTFMRLVNSLRVEPLPR